MTSLTLPVTLGQILAHPACPDAAQLWVGVPLDTPIVVWDALAACLLARADGRGANIEAVRYTVAEAYRSNRLHAICMYHYERPDEVAYSVGAVQSARSPGYCETCDAEVTS